MASASVFQLSFRHDSTPLLFGKLMRTEATFTRCCRNWKESPFQWCGNWSADGSYFFHAGHDNDQAIWVMREHPSILSSSGTPALLISGPLRLSVPVPSPDGKKLFVMGEERRVEPVH
jgi:hypothetical protein